MSNTSVSYLAKQSPAGIHLFKVNNGNTKTMCEICSKLTIKTQSDIIDITSGLFIISFEQISLTVLRFLFLV